MPSSTCVKLVSDQNEVECVSGIGNIDQWVEGSGLRSVNLVLLCIQNPDPKAMTVLLIASCRTLVTFSVLSAGNSHITAVVRDSCLQIGMV